MLIKYASMSDMKDYTNNETYKQNPSLSPHTLPTKTKIIDFLKQDWIFFFNYKW